MESLDREWIFHGNVQQCEQFEKTPNTLGLKNMAGVFILVGAGIVGGICLIIIEVVYKKHQIKKQKRMELARHAIDKWRGTIEVSDLALSAAAEINGKFPIRFTETKDTSNIPGDAKAIQRGTESRHNQSSSG